MAWIVHFIHAHSRLNGLNRAGASGLTAVPGAKGCGSAAIGCGAGISAHQRNPPYRCKSQPMTASAFGTYGNGRRFNWFNRNHGAGWDMEKIKSPRRIGQPPLEAGQLWRMAEANLLVVMVGKLLVHYKLGKPDAVRVPHSCNCIKTIEKYLKTKKAVLA
jgi:hypothetical protein